MPNDSTANQINKPLPSLDLAQGDLVFGSLLDTEILLELGLHQKLVEKISLALKNLKDTQIIEDGIITLLEVNKAGAVLHQACLEKRYSGILKPIFIKEKSIKGAISSPFLDVLAESELISRNQALAEYGISLGAIPLNFPLEHLEKLVDLGFLAIRSISKHEPFIMLIAEPDQTIMLEDQPHQAHLRNYLPYERLKKLFDLDSVNIEIDGSTISILKKEHIYRVKLPAKYEGSMDDFFTSEFYQQNKHQLVGVAYNSGEPVEVLGVKTIHSQAFMPIICDIDAHNCGVKGLDEQVQIYDTAYQLSNLSQEVEKLLAKKLTPSEISQRTQAINPLMGKLSAQELIIYHAINSYCARPLGLEVIFQHGATANMGQEDVDKIRAKSPETDFPAITDETLIAVIHADHLIRVTGSHILILYDELKKSGYNFKLQDLWREQLSLLKQNHRYSEYQNSVKEHLINIGRTNPILPLLYDAAENQATSPKMVKAAQPSMTKAKWKIWQQEGLAASYPDSLFLYGLRENKATGPRAAKVIEKIRQEQGDTLALQTAKQFFIWAKNHRRNFNMREVLVFTQAKEHNEFHQEINFLK